MPDTIKRIYIGLPSDFKYKVYWVERKFRVNPLSHNLGGCDVIIEYHSGKVFGYDWIKYPSKYISVIFNQTIFKDISESELLNNANKINIIKNEVSKIYLRKYDTNTFENSPFTKIWDSNEDYKTPWEKLEIFDFRPDSSIKSVSPSTNKNYIAPYMIWWNKLEYDWQELIKENFYQNFNVKLINFSRLAYELILSFNTFDIGYNNLDSVNSLDPLCTFSKIKILNIVTHGAGVFDKTDLDFLKYFPKLEFLSIQFHENSLDISGLKNCPQLKGLNITWTNIKGISSIVYLNELKYLNLFKSLILDYEESKHYFKKILSLPKLKYLCWNYESLIENAIHLKNFKQVYEEIFNIFDIQEVLCKLHE